MEKVYRAEEPHDLKGLPPPRYDILWRKRAFYFMIPVQASRGCNRSCDFCSIRRFYRTGLRKRPIEEVLRDIELAGRRRTICFTDDNLVADRRFALELFRALKPLRIQWFGQANIEVGKDEELLDAMLESGCAGLYIGLESLSKKALDEVGKGFQRPQDYPLCLQNLRKWGIGAVVSVIFGFDSDPPDVFDRMVDFLIEQKVPGFMPYILVPFPGSNMAWKLNQQGRYLERDLLRWDIYDGTHCVFRPMHMSPEELEEGLWHSIRRFYSLQAVLKRVFLPPNISRKAGIFRSLRLFLWAGLTNLLFSLAIRKLKKVHPFWYY